MPFSTIFKTPKLAPATNVPYLVSDSESDADFRSKGYNLKQFKMHIGLLC